MEEYESDSDHSDVDLADFDTEKRLADKPVITRCGRQVKTQSLVIKRATSLFAHLEKFRLICQVRRL